MKVKIKDISINYEVIGEGKPVVMIHGLVPDHRLMTGCMEPIFKNKSGFKRIYVDLPGMGESECADWINNSDVMLDILIEFINRVIPCEKFLLAGESYGGYLSRGVVYKMPERVDGLLLICPVIIADHSKRNVPKHEVLVKDKKLLSSLEPEDAEDFNSIAVVQSPEIYKRYSEEIMCGVKAANQEFTEKLQKYGYEFTFDVDNISRKFDKPSLVLLGRQDFSVGYKDSMKIIENYPRASWVVLDSAGHNLQLEQEKIFDVLVSEWLLRAC